MLRRMPGTPCVYLKPDGTPILLLLVRGPLGISREVREFGTITEAVDFARAAMAGNWPARPVGTGDWHAGLVRQHGFQSPHDGVGGGSDGQAA